MKSEKQIKEALEGYMKSCELYTEMLVNNELLSKERTDEYVLNIRMNAVVARTLKWVLKDEE